MECLIVLFKPMHTMVKNTTFEGMFFFKYNEGMVFLILNEIVLSI